MEGGASFPNSTIDDSSRPSFPVGLLGPSRRRSVESAEMAFADAVTLRCCHRASSSRGSVVAGSSDSGRIAVAADKAGWDTDRERRRRRCRSTSLDCRVASVLASSWDCRGADALLASLDGSALAE